MKFSTVPKVAAGLGVPLAGGWMLEKRLQKKYSDGASEPKKSKYDLIKSTAKYGFFGATIGCAVASAMTLDRLGVDSAPIYKQGPVEVVEHTHYSIDDSDALSIIAKAAIVPVYGWYEATTTPLKESKSTTTTISGSVDAEPSYVFSVGDLISRERIANANPFDFRCVYEIDKAGVPSVAELVDGRVEFRNSIQNNPLLEERALQLCEDAYRGVRR